MKDLLTRSLRASVGLFVFGFGVYLTIQANIGLAPWDCFNMGASSRLGISYGAVSILASALIILIDLLLGERIGVGTVLDALLVGASVDMFTAIGIAPKADGGVWLGLAMLILGLFIMAYGQYLYMSARLCCGPRDSLLVGLGKRLRKWPIGAVNALLQLAVLALGALLGGPVGLGTVASVFLMGVIVQIVFKALRFDPRDVTHDDLLATAKSLRAPREARGVTADARIPCGSPATPSRPPRKHAC